MKFNTFLKSLFLFFVPIFMTNCQNEFFIKAESGKYYHRLTLWEFILLALLQIGLLYLFLKIWRKR